MPTILNASPRHIPLGTDDKSTRVVYPEPEAIPQHLPKFYLFTEKGPTIPTLVSGPAFLSLYGEDSIEPTKKYFTHATLFAKKIMSEANSIMVHRITDPTAVKAGVTVYADILEGQIPNYERYANGSIVYDVNMDPVLVTGENTVDGNFLSYIAGPAIANDASGPIPGTMSDGTNTSTMYPLFTIPAEEVGEYYNNIGITLSAPVNDGVDKSYITKTRIYPYNISVVNKKSGTTEIVGTLFKEKALKFTFRDDVLDPLTEKKFDFKTLLTEKWSNTTDPLLPLRYPELGDVHVFKDNVKFIETKVYEAEICKLNDTIVTDPNGDTYTTQDFTDYDLTSEDDQVSISNILTYKTSSNVEYFGTVGIVDGITQTVPALHTTASMSSNTPIFMLNGSDGLTDNDTFETVVSSEMDEYLDSDSHVMDTAINVESILYDSGFSLDLKKKLCNFVGLRKDTFVALSTYVYTEDSVNLLTLSEQVAVATIIKNKLKLMPESDYFGTPVMRGIIVMGSGKLLDDSHPYRVPQLLEIAVKSARYMGAGNGSWKEGFSFDRFPGNVVTVLKDLYPSFIPEGSKNKIWASGIIWTQPLDRRQYHIPAKQTVYDNDTSVLNAFETAMAICTINKINADAWRRFTGSVGLSNSELEEEVIAYVSSRVLRIFDGNYTIIPRVVITDADEQRGYSWHLIVEIYANNMKTVMVHNVEAHRASDLTV